MSKNFQEYLTAENERSGATEFLLHSSVSNGVVTFYIHASGKDSDTPNFEVKGNTLIPISSADVAWPFPKNIQ